MRWILHAVLLTTAFAASGGCGTSQLPHTKSGALLMIEGSVNDIVSTIMSPTYRSRSKDLGTDSDRIGMALLTFVKETEGTALSADAKELQSKFQALEKLTASRAPIAKQREAAKALQESVATVKGKL
jgi:hypothetical protein